MSFDIEGIDSLRNKITNAKSVGITHNIIDELYTNVKLIFLKPAKTTGMTKIVKSYLVSQEDMPNINGLQKSVRYYVKITCF